MKRGNKEICDTWSIWVRLANFPPRRDINGSLRACHRTTHRDKAFDLSIRYAPFVSVKTPELLSQLGDQMRFLKHSTTRHALTRKSSHNRVHNVVFCRYIFPSHLSSFGHRALLVYRQGTTIRNKVVVDLKKKHFQVWRNSCLARHILPFYSTRNRGKHEQCWKDIVDNRSWRNSHFDTPTLAHVSVRLVRR